MIQIQMLASNWHWEGSLQVYVHPKTSVRRKMQDSQCQMTYDETEVASTPRGDENIQK